MPRSAVARSLAAIALAVLLPLAGDAASLHRIGFLPGTSSPRFSFVKGSGNDVYFYGSATPSPPTSLLFANIRWSIAGGLEEFAGLSAPQPTPELTGGTAFYDTLDAQGRVVAEFDSLGGATPVPWMPRTFDSGLRDATPDARVFLGWYGANSSSSAMFRYTVGGALEIVGDPSDEAVVQPVGLPNHGGFAVANELGLGLVGAGYRWLPDGSTETIDPPPTQPTDVFSAGGVSQDGSTILGWVHAPSSPSGTAARWTEAGGTELLADPGGLFASSAAFYLAPDGRIYGEGFLAASGNRAAMVWDPANGMRELQPLLVAEHGLDFAGDQLVGAVPSEDGDELVCLLVDPSVPGDLEGAVIFLDPAVPALPYGFGVVAFALLLGAGRVQLARRGPTSPDGSR